MRERFVAVHWRDLGPYVESLRAMERAIEYPIEDGEDAFCIDHGSEYHPFFTTLGDAWFILGLEGDRVVANMVGIRRAAILRGERRSAIYLADMKVARDRRGGGLARRMVQWGFLKMLRDPAMRFWRYAYLAAMRGARGDVMRTVRGAHPGKLVLPAARLAVYFVAPEKLAALRVEGAPPAPSETTGIDLSARPRHLEPPGLLSTAGRKDLRLRSTGAHWPLVHLPLGPGEWKPTWGAYLSECGKALVARSGSATACFGIDARLSDHIAWLSRQQIEPGATCTVYAFSLSLRSRGAKWLHLATSEI